jgi:hypothetical protein
MSYWQPHPLHFWHPQRQRDRWTWETLNKAPRMPYPLPGEIEEGWDIYRILEEIERLRPIIEAARKEWFERRRAEMPPEVKAWIAEKAAPLQRNSNCVEPAAPRPSRSHPTASLTPEERRARKREQTRLSNQRKRAERKALGLPYK